MMEIFIPWKMVLVMKRAFMIAISQVTSMLPVIIRCLKITHRKIFNIRRTKSQNLNDSRLVLLLPLPNPLKPSVKSRMKM